MGLVIAYVALSVISIYFGVKLMGLATRDSKPPPATPVARIANPEGAEKAYVAGVRVARKVKRLERPVTFLGGVALVIAPFLGAAFAVKSLFSFHMDSKGRVLRIRGKARLAEPARGDGWTGDAVALVHAPDPAERAVLGELWLVTARMEHASVAAFSQLSLHLSALGAPARLLEATHQAALEEIRHTRACFAVVRALTGAREDAGPIPSLGAARAEAIDHVRLAVGSLVDGALAEGIAADVAARSSARAEEPAIKDILAMIAREERGHAELAWDVLAWCLADDATGRVAAAVRARVDVLDREVAPRMPDLPGVSPATLARYGVIDQDALGALAVARIAEVQARARALLAPAALLAA